MSLNQINNNKGKGKGREIVSEEEIEILGSDRTRNQQSIHLSSPTISIHSSSSSTSTSSTTTIPFYTSNRSMVRTRSNSTIPEIIPIASTSSSTSNNFDPNIPISISSTIVSSNTTDLDQPSTSKRGLNDMESSSELESSRITGEGGGGSDERSSMNINTLGVIFDENLSTSTSFPSSSSSSTTPKSHSISRKTSPLPHRSTNPPTPSTSLTIDLRQSLPGVISQLTCPSCSHLLNNPTTLVCGHTLCMECSLPSGASLRTITSFSDQSNTQQGRDLQPPNQSSSSSSESQFTRNPTIPLHSNSINLPRSISSSSSNNDTNFIGPIQINSDPTVITSILTSSSSTSTPTSIHLPRTISSSSNNSSRSRPLCSHESCKGKEKVTTLAEPKLDFVLQKILGVLKREIGGLAEEVSTFGVDGEYREGGEEEEGAEVVPVASGSSSRPGLNSMPGGSESSIASSAGGGEDPSDEESKRVHRSPTWTTSKRMRRKSVATSIKAPEPIHLTRSDRLEDLFDFKKKSLPLLIELQSELDCQVCAQLLHKPITTPCGHTYCRACLARSLDHSDKCPTCRAPMPSFTFFQSQPINSTTSNLISLLFPSLIAERAAAVEAEERSTAFDTPIFVCTLAWPNLPTYIHIFEPRYRLMMRRVMENGRKFGMVLPSRGGGGTAEYGTMLEVQSWNMIEDGRSIVETIGAYRFRLLEKDTLDGYTVGRVERVDDISEEQEAELERIALARNPPRPSPRSSTSIDLSTSDPTPTVDNLNEGEEGPAPDFAATPPTPAIELSTAELMEICLEFIQTLRTGSAPWVLQRLNNTIGPMPSNPSDFSFWIAEVMPVDDQVKSTLLQITSPRERLRLIVFWIEQFRSSWWFSRGCNMM